MQAQTATLPPPDPYQASWRKGLIPYPASHLAYLSGQWYFLVLILLPWAEGSPPFCSGPPDWSGNRTQGCRISLLPKACTLLSDEEDVDFTLYCRHLRYTTLVLINK